MALTRRALAVVAVLALLVFSFAGALRVWLMQSQELTVATAQIDQRRGQIAELESELTRWQDSAYVRAQARARLGWVMPGEVGYRVIGPDGEVLSGTSEIEGVGAAHSTGLEERWWEHLSTSLQETDRLDRPVR
ncbi:MAG: septum formation initiator family protein [Nigerium sp.]|nr:septum formation initiator family protein [Nigerium sp.]